MNKDIFLTNSLSNKKAKFIPIDPKKIGMYVCGPTVYDNPHIGNARPLVVFDILFKVLKCKYGNSSVRYVRNITDIDDKIISSSIEKNISIDNLTKNITNIFHQDCKYLNCEVPTNEPKATENISLMIEMINKLIVINRLNKTQILQLVNLVSVSNDINDLKDNLKWESSKSFNQNI